MKRLTAILITEPQPVTGKTALKFHNIAESGPEYQRSLAFFMKFPGVKEINFYYKRRPGEARGRFKEKIYTQ